MTNVRPDRRIVRTKRLLKGALLELIQLRSYESITVDQIADRADVGRSTFYSHFTSKDDLLLYGFDQFLMGLTDHAAMLGEPASGPADILQLQSGSASTGPVANGFRFSLPLLQHIHSQKQFFLATIVSASDLRIRKKVIGLFVKMIRLELDMNSRNQSGTKEQLDTGTADEVAGVAHAHAIAGAFLAIAAWWLELAPNRSAEFVNDVFSDAVQSGCR